MLRVLLRLHGVFFIACFIMPVFPVLTSDMESGAIIGTLVLLVWCAYFCQSVYSAIGILTEEMDSEDYYSEIMNSNGRLEGEPRNSQGCLWSSAF